MNTALSQARLKELLHYDSDTGLFTWKISRGCMHAGQVAGGPNSKGYRQIKIDGVVYKAHRLAHLYVVGAWPDDKIDHANTVRGDNRFSNLREATTLQNNRNTTKRSDNTSGFKGVSFNKNRCKWEAYIRYDGRRRHLGLFCTAELAGEFYDLAAQMLFGEFYSEAL